MYEENGKFRVFFNKETGNIVMTNEKNMQMHESYIDTGIDVKTNERLSALIVFCPECEKYHFWGAVGVKEMPVGVRAYSKAIQRYGCWFAEKMKQNPFWKILETDSDYDLFIDVAGKVDLFVLKRIAKDIYAMRWSMNIDPRSIANDVLKLIAETF